MLDFSIVKVYKLSIYLITILSISCRNMPSENDMPPFKLLLMDSVTTFSSENIPNGQPSLLLYFSPECEHCQSQIKNLLINIPKLNHVGIYLISNDPFDQIRLLNTCYHLSDYSNIMVGRDYKFGFFNYYKPKSTPYLFVFNSHKRIKKIFVGDVDVKEIIKQVNALF